MNFKVNLARATVILTLFMTAQAFAALEHGSRLRPGVIAGGQNHTCALRSTGKVDCWGRNFHGQLGIGTTSNQEAAPVLVSDLSDVTAITAGENHTCALLATGKVKCWGDNAQKQLGKETGANYSVPVEVSYVSRAVGIAAGQAHTCALLSNGKVRCWGDNFYGQLGNGTNIASAVPVTVSNVSNAIGLAAGGNHNCILRLTGRIACWGLGDEGQTGDPDLKNSNLPDEVSALQPTVASISAGYGHTCARLSNGQVRCWGRNTSAQLGDGTQVSSAAPVTVKLSSTKSLAGAIAVAAGEDNTCALLSSGGVKCWGGNARRQLGNTATTGEFSAVPVDVGNAQGAAFKDAAALSLGSEHACMVTAAGIARCWGSNAYRQMGAGSTAPFAAVPSKVTGFTVGAKPLALSSTSAGHSCVLLGGGVIKCWGRNAEGQVGTGSVTGFSGGPIGIDTPTQVISISNAVAVAVGELRSCAILVSGRVWCWGGFNSQTAGTPVQVPNITGAVSVTVGLYHYCALLGTGRVWCWGFDDYGQLGNGTGTPPDSTTPVEVKGLVTNVQGVPSVTGITAALNTSCARLTTGSVRCWGAEANAGTSNAESAVLVTSKAASVVAGGGTGLPRIHACALPGLETTMGNRKCWGENGQGQFGDDTKASSLTPIVVTSPSFLTNFAPGYFHACARMADGTARCWGDDSFNQLGNGPPAEGATTFESLSPVSVKDLTAAVMLSSGDLFSCALRASGEVRCWGFANDSRLGNPTVVGGAPTPVAVQGL
jgi:alpha-tubulin suppressor-like RCC1 family protein